MFDTQMIVVSVVLCGEYVTIQPTRIVILIGLAQPWNMTMLIVDREDINKWFMFQNHVELPWSGPCCVDKY